MSRSQIADDPVDYAMLMMPGLVDASVAFWKPDVRVNEEAAFQVTPPALPEAMILFSEAYLAQPHEPHRFRMCNCIMAETVRETGRCRVEIEVATWGPGCLDRCNKRSFMDQ